jgi:hypothetical protein
MSMEAPQSKTDFAKLSTQASEIESLYAERGVKLPRECTLATWIANVRSVAERRATSPNSGHTAMEHFRAVQLYRVTDAILALRDVEEGDRYLRKITANLDFFNPEQSVAKDIFWELELWWMIRRKLPTARLMDPPDIMLNLDGGTLGLACKAVYSEASVEKALSTGVKQITGNCDAGVVAFNIDSLLPKDCVVKAKDRAGLDERLHSKIDGFIERHRRHMDRYLNQQRLGAVVVCISGVGDIHGWSVPFNTVRSTLVYAAGAPTKIARSLVGQFNGILNFGFE